MNRIDKQWYRALRFLSRYSALDILNLIKEDKKKFRKYVPKDLDRTLQRNEYIIFKPGITNVVTMKGLQYLRDLEEIRRKDWTLIASVIAVIISLVALAKSMGWI